MTKTTTAVLLTAALTAAASAGLTGFTNADWQSAGDNLLTVDANGNTWLDWTVTTSRSFNDISSQFGAGGEFEGFRYATEAEMIQLYANAGTPVVDPLDTTDPAYASPLADLMSFIGDTNGSGSTLAFYDLAGSNADTPSLIGDLQQGPHHMVTLFTQAGLVSLRYANASDEVSYSNAGHALVLIPAPGSAALLGLGGLIAARRRRH